MAKIWYPGQRWDPNVHNLGQHFPMSEPERDFLTMTAREQFSALHRAVKASGVDGREVYYAMAQLARQRLDRRG